MFACRNCTRSLFKALTETHRAALPSPPARLSASPLPSSFRSQRRKVASAVTAQKPSARISEDGLEDVKTTLEVKEKKIKLYRELQYLTDNVKLAKHIVKLLKQNDAGKALSLVQLAAKDRECTVSWNHLINHEMNNGRPSSALKIFNDMKKRFQRPDAYTFTILFRGLAKNAELSKTGASDSALKVYHSMFNENSPVKPSIIHTNAVLSVCSRASDTDAMFSVAARLPSRGPGAPDPYSFTTILNALRAEALKPLRNETEEDTLDRRQRLVFQGRRIWADIVERWKANTVTIDEQLTCAMGRLLLVGNLPQDADDVLSLVEQTMRIQRLRPRRIGMDEESKSNQLEAPEGSITGLATQDQEGPETTDSSEFQPLKETARPRLYAVPWCNALSLVIDACTRMGETTLAQKYWDELTTTVKPDKDNYHMYLRLLRVRRASSLAVDLVKDMAQSEEKGGIGTTVEPKTFKLAMSTCSRNWKSQHTLGHGVKLLELMQTYLLEPDIEVILNFADILGKNEIHYPTKDVIEAANILFSLYTNIRNLNAFGREPLATTTAAAPGQNNSKETLNTQVQLEPHSDSAEALDPVSLAWAPSPSPSPSSSDSPTLNPKDIAESPAFESHVAAGHLRKEERLKLKEFGRRMESVLGHISVKYFGDLSHAEMGRLSEYRARIRDWLFRRSRRSEEGLEWRRERSRRDRGLVGEGLSGGKRVMPARNWAGYAVEGEEGEGEDGMGGRVAGGLRTTG